ncbi:MAG: hypothetical protein HY928_04385 [Elusimicrobia bacterium]|nr:hypothetical protein [Elusimicrobiota bacterium]
MKRLLLVGLLSASPSSARADVVFSAPLKFDLWPGRSWPGGPVYVTGVQISLLNGANLPNAEKPPKYTSGAGFHFGILAASNDDIIGVRSALVSGGRDIIGIEAAAFNYSERVLGIQGGFSNLAAKRLYGIQAGVINLAGDPIESTDKEISGCRGVQVGLVSFCGRSLKGIQIGAVNIALNSRALPFSPGMNIGF